MQMFQHPLGRFDEYRGIIWNSPNIAELFGILE